MAETSDYFGTRVRPRAPGVYIEDVAPSQAPVFWTGVPVFVGFSQQRGQAHAEGEGEDTRFFCLTNWDQFDPCIGQTLPGGFLAYAVRGFFENGGKRCVVVPLRLNEDQQHSAALKQDALRDLFKKDARGRRGFLEDIEDTDLVCVPDILMRDILQSPETVFELQQQVLEYCKDMGDR